MESHKHYTQSETEFLLSCAETDENELLDYEEFVERFHEPAKVTFHKDFLFSFIFCSKFLHFFGTN